MTSHKSGCSAEDSAMEDHRINLFRTADAFWHAEILLEETIAKMEEAPLKMAKSN